eukprot:evm.model.NODE_48527_length_18767_cov_16.646240.2
MSILIALLTTTSLLPHVTAVKLGKVSPRVWENLEAEGINAAAMEEAAAETAAAAAEEEQEKVSAKEAEEARRFKAETARREALDKAKDIDWKSTADAAKKERELDEKYGVWKHVILNPWFQWIMGLLDDLFAIELVGEARMAPAAIVVLLFMLYRAKQPLSFLALAAAFLYNLHPILVGGLTVGMKVWALRRKPKGYVPPKKRAGVGVGVGAGATGATADEDNDKRPTRSRKGDGLSEDARDMQTLTSLPKEVDHIVLGSDVGGLYTAALLARVGHTVLVLESGDSLGNCTTEMKGVQVDYGLLNVGKLQVYENMLQSAYLEGAPAVKWSRVGTEEDGYSFDVARVGKLGDVVYRAGKQALIDDQVTSAPGPENRGRVGMFVTRMELVAREQAAFWVGRLFGQKTAGWIAMIFGQGYGGIGGRTVQEVTSVTLPEWESLDVMRGGFRTENLGPAELSFAAYVSAMSQGMEGLNWPQGGYRSVARALVPTIKKAGGRVVTRVKVKGILINETKEGGKKGGKTAPTPAAATAAVATRQRRAVGVVLENGLEIKCRESIIASSGVVPLFTQWLPKEVALPFGGDHLEEARPRLYTVLLLKGSAEELDLPASDYYQVPTEEGVGGEIPGGWFHVYFPSAKDPSGVAAPATWGGGGKKRQQQHMLQEQFYSTCVIETEADDDIVEACYRRMDGSTSSRPAVQIAAAGLAATGAAVPPSPPPSLPNAGVFGPGPGLKYYKMKQPSDAKIRRLQQMMVKRLVQLYPQMAGHFEEEHGGMQTLGPFRVGLSHRPARFVAPGLRTRVVPGVGNVFLGGGDLVLGTFGGGVMGGWLAAHSALGYGAVDLLLLGRSLNEDLKNIPRGRYEEEGDEEEEGEMVAGGDRTKEE